MAKQKSKQNLTIKVEGVEAVKRGLKNLGLTAKQSRTEINKALRPAANMLSKGIRRAYKNQFKSKNPGRRYDPSSKSYRNGMRTADTIGIITARRSRQPGLYVGPRLRKVNPHYWEGKTSKNLAAMQIEGYKNRSGALIKFPNVFEITADSMGSQVSAKAQKDLGKLIDKMIKKAGF
jgi:hypothetical protein